jgi:hypothetical protein
MKLIKNIQLGADPEIFLVDTRTNLLVSSIDKIGGSKWAPRELGDGFAVQEDNVLAEINIPPAKTADDFVKHIQRGIKLLEEALPDDNLALLIQASGFMPADELKDERACVFGCDPDFNAWLAGAPNDHPQADNPLLRSAGGHIHVGYTLTDKNIQRESVNENIVRWMDYYLGVPSILMDADTERRKLYGKAGAYRHKSYGVEYRTLSSFWLTSDKLISWAFNQTQKAIKRAAASEFIDERIGKKVQNIINSTNKIAAEKFVHEHELVLV